MRPPTTYIVPGEHSSPRVGAAFARGCGGALRSYRDGLQTGAFAAFCSPPVWPLLRQVQREGRPYLYADHAYFGRGTYFRVTRDAYQHDGRGPVRTPERWRRLGHAIQPWRRDGRHIVVCPNSEVYCALHGFRVTDWLAAVTQQLRTLTDREVRVRWKVDARQRPLAMDLVNAWAVVVYSSASALWALMAGVPVVTLAPFAASARMGLTNLGQIETPMYPDDREAFFVVLANHQWTLSELAQGHAWRQLQIDEASRAA